MKGYDLSQLDVMVVEDSRQMRAILTKMLGSFGVSEMRFFTEGGEAYEAFCQQPADIVITDWVMKPVSGMELVRRLRDDSQSPYPDVPIIMVTSNSTPAETEEARAAGVDAVLTKPLRCRIVYACIAGLIDRCLETA